MPDGKPLRIPLVEQFTFPGGTANAPTQLGMGPAIINGYVETLPSGERIVYKRPCFTWNNDVADASVRSDFTNFNGTIVGVSKNKFYSNILTGTFLANADGSTGSAYSFANSIATPTKLFVHSDTFAYVYDSSGPSFTQVTDVNYPAATVPGAVWLDGTYYVMDTSANIRGSNLNDVTTWNPLNSIQAQIEPDAAIVLARQLSYVLAFKSSSVEVFYNAGNATGSPLARQTGSKLNYGCANAATLQELDGALIWVGASKNGKQVVLRLENLTPTIVSTPAVERLLTGSSPAFMWSFTLTIPGHSFYIINDSLSKVSLVYDTVEKLWYIWTTQSGINLPFYTSAVTYGAAFTCYVGGGTNQGGIATGPSGVYSVQLTGTDYSFTASNTIDTPFNFDIYTSIFDGKTRRRKYLKVLDVVADVPMVTWDSSNQPALQSKGLLQIRHSDNGYKTWSNFRSIDLTLNRPRLLDCGTFISRSYHLRYKVNTPLLLQAIEMQVEEGTL